MSSNLSHLHSKFKAGSQIDYGHFLTLFYHFVKLHITFLHIDTNFILCKAGIMQHREKSLSPKQRWNTSLPELSLVRSAWLASFPLPFLGLKMNTLCEAWQCIAILGSWETRRDSLCCRCPTWFWLQLIPAFVLYCFFCSPMQFPMRKVKPGP